MKRLLFSSLLLLSGCSALDSFSAGPAYDPYTLYLQNGAAVRPRTELLNQYACMSGVPLVCECTSRLGATCDCSC